MNNIEQLIDKYFRGETTLEEEAQLRRYFQRPDIAPELETYRPLFGLLEQERNRQLGPSFDEKVYQKIGPSQKKAPVVKAVYRWAGAAAASLILVLSVWWLYPAVEPDPSSAINWEQYEPEDPKEAFRITRDALMKVSIELNRGARKAAGEVSQIKRIMSE